LITIACVGSSQTGSAQGVDQPVGFSPVIETAWLADHLGEEGLVVLHVGSERNYAAGHIPSAVLVTMADVSPNGTEDEGALRVELPEPADLQAKLRSWGISSDSRIVVYWTGNGVTPATRTLFVLDWAGLGDQSVLLNGGMAGWEAAGMPTTGAPVQAEPGDVTVSPRDELVVDAAWVGAHAHDAGVAVVDARSAAFFEGTSPSTGPAGHIPGASSVPWDELYDQENSSLLPVAERRAILRAAGIQEGDTVVAYCHIGQFATYVLLNARSLGHPVILYDGAFQDWAARGLPLEKGGGGG